MPKVSIDTSLNIPTLMSIMGGALAAVVFIVSLRGDVRTHSAQITQLTQELGEIRRLHLQVASKVQMQEQSIQDVKLVANNNTKQLKSLPDTVVTKVFAHPAFAVSQAASAAGSPPTEVKKKIPR